MIKKNESDAEDKASKRLRQFEEERQPVTKGDKEKKEASNEEEEKHKEKKKNKIDKKEKD